MRFSMALALLAVTATTPALATNLIGQSATATFSSIIANSSNQFVSPAVVGAGTEFSGDFVDVFNQNWILSLDLAAASITLTISESTRSGDGNVSSAGSVLDLNISGLTGLSPAFLSNYACNGNAFACSTAGGGPNLVNLASTDSTVSFGLTALRDGEVYVIAFDAVPEPASWTLMIAGFGLAGAVARRRRVAATA